ncbi:MAG TPA: UDP-glucose/GDP-mannose dehydrogenase family protein [Phycisphaerae bacterium]|nr:UDP-glucose/GDP-mannose dehydrogenase family protein [Phycisphaerae bacterium]HNU44406.1 UDP-glucose/GDP-mannose dehydrogenase family protein [Phycisphaerae bacterium]
MNVGVVGSGYVGLVAGACFADAGNRVICVDADPSKIEMLQRGEIPIYEPGLKEIVERNAEAGRLIFTTDLVAGVKQSRVLFLAVGTPEAADGSADLSAVLEVARQIGKAMDGYRIVVMKSTVPVGTHRKVSEAIAAQTGHPFDYVSNPEFLKEGAAIEDFTRPDRVVIGTTNPTAVAVMKELYAPFMRKSERIFVMDPASAEMTKYAANALLATKISFMNEIAGLCERFGADVDLVRRGVGSDSRLGHAFLFPGVGYGGSCFPKDVSALMKMGEAVGRPVLIVNAVHQVNQRQRKFFAQRVLEHFGEKCPETTLAVWGLAFKARTDDVRESPAIACVRMFLEKGMKVRAYDPEAAETGRAAVGGGITICRDGYEALDGADALVIFTDWPEFRNPDFDTMAQKLRQRLVFDGRNMYDPLQMAQRGFTYYCIGRPSVLPKEL